DLADQYHDLKATLARHGVQITRRFVIEELEAIRASNYDVDVVHEMLERSEQRLAQQAADHATADSEPGTSVGKSLRDALAELERSMVLLEKHLN
ncbi:MAG: hypothetical protein GXP37_15805, partial [Chloroflexi bacterium]|nr:hypothetical protein [Chloroflexota bacterium]